MTAGQRRLKCAFKLVHGLSAYEAPFQSKRADIAALSNVQIHSGPHSLFGDFALQQDDGLLISSYFRITTAARLVKQTFA